VNLRGAAVLDVGCARGGLCAMHDRGAQCRGSTSTRAHRGGAGAAGRPGNPFAVANLYEETVTFLDRSYDLLVLHDVFEHLDRKEEMLAKLARCMKPDGGLLITFPPYYSAYGAHQQHLRATVARLPFFHLVRSRCRPAAAASRRAPARGGRSAEARTLRMACGSSRVSRGRRLPVAGSRRTSSAPTTSASASRRSRRARGLHPGARRAPLHRRGVPPSQGLTGYAGGAAVGIVLVNWNGASDARVPAIAPAVSYGNAFTVVVDNASADGSVEAIRAAHPDVTVLPQRTNLLFPGEQRGMRMRCAGCGLLLLLNNDTEVAPDFLGYLVERLQHEPARGGGTEILYHARPDTLWFAGGRSRSGADDAAYGHPRTDDGRHDRPHDIDYATGCAVLVTRGAVERVGMLDTGYRMYTETPTGRSGSAGRASVSCTSRARASGTRCR